MQTPERDLSDYLQRQDLDEQQQAHAERTANALTIPEWMSGEMKERYIRAQFDNIFNGDSVQEPEEWHNNEVQHCTCAYCKAEWEMEYEESMEVLKQENLTKWRK